MIETHIFAEEYGQVLTYTECCMQTLGTVKWFNNAKGYGFIQPDNGSDDVFAHFSAIEMDGFRTLKPGMRVKFILAEGDKGAQAKEIQVIPNGDNQAAAQNKPQAEALTQPDEGAAAPSAEESA